MKTGFTLTSATKPVDDIPNSDSTVCPAVWSLVKTDGAPLDGWMASALTISGSGYLEVD
jgi:hypothetical protein